MKGNMPFSEWKIKICFFTFSCRLLSFLSQISNDHKKSVRTKYHESFQLSQNGIDIFSWLKIERRFSVRTVFSLVCEFSQSRSGPSIYFYINFNFNKIDYCINIFMEISYSVNLTGISIICIEKSVMLTEIR